MHVMTIVPDEVERVCRFVRVLTLSTRYYVFRSAKEGASFRSIMCTAKEAKLMLFVEFGGNKKAQSPGQLLGASSRGKGTHIHYSLF